MTYMPAMQQHAPMVFAPPTEPAEPGLIEIAKFSDHQLDRLRDLLGRVTAFNDRMLGVNPQDGPVGPAPVPNGIIDELRMKQAALSKLVDALLEQSDRFSAIA